MVATASSTPPRRLTREARRAQLLDVAARLVAERGAERLTMDALGPAAGASKTLAYAYFDNADDVLGTLWQRELHRLYATVEHLATGAANFDDAIARAFRAYFDIVAHSGTLLAELEHAARNRGLSDGGDTDAFLRWLAALIDRELDLGPRAARFHAAVVARTAALHATLWLGSGLSRSELERVAVAFVLGGLRALPPRGDRPMGLASN